MTCKHWLYWCVALTSTLTSVARAEPSPAAEALFQAGRDAVRRGDYAEACARFNESQRLEPALGTRLNLALCEEELGHLAEAWALFRALARALPTGDPRMPLVESHAAALALRVPTLVLHAGAALPPDSRVVVGETSVTPSAFGVPIPLNPGRLVLRVLAPGFQVRAYEVALAAGEKGQLVVDPGPKLAEAATGSHELQPGHASPPARRDPKHSLRTAGMIGLGVAGSALVGSLVAGYLAIHNKNTMNQECDASSACSAAGLSAARSGQRFASLATASFALSVAFAAGGTTLLLIANPHPGMAGFAPPGSGVPQLGATLQGSFQ